jgi:hypothetical protein
MEVFMDDEMIMDGQRPYCEEDDYYAPVHRVPPRRVVEPYYSGGSLRAELIDLKNRVLLFLAFVSLGVLVWAMIILTWVRVLAIAVACALLLLGLAWVAIAFLKWVNKPEIIRVGTTGGYKQDLTGKMVPMAPLNPVTPKQATRASTNIEVKIPKLSEVLDRLIDGGNELIGYRENGIADYAEGPRGTVAVLGSGESGKSVTTLIRILIALLQGKDVTVCDPHKWKPRSLYKKLEPLEPWMTFAFTEAEIRRAAEGFSHELQERKENRGDGRAKLIVYDEFKSLVKQSKDPEVSKAVVKSVEQASDEGMGFDLGTIVVCHGVKEDAIGDVAVREAFKAVFCHNIDPAQSELVLKEKRFSKKTNKLHKGHLYYRNEYAEIDYHIMPYGDVEDAKAAARMLERLGMPKKHERVKSAHVQDAPQQASAHRDLVPFNHSSEDVARILAELGIYTVHCASTVPTGMPDLPMKTPLVEEDEDDFLSSDEENNVIAMQARVSHAQNAVSVNETAPGTVVQNEVNVTKQQEGETNSRMNDLTSAVSGDLRKTIKRMHTDGMALRKIAALVGLSGYNYKVFQAVCREEGLPLPGDQKGA